MINLFDQVYKTEFVISNEERRHLYAKIVEDHLELLKLKYYTEENKIWKNVLPYNFNLNETYASFRNKLKTFFYEKSRNLFSRKLVSFNKIWVVNDTCWAYVSNKDDYDHRNIIHDHMSSSTIHGIYYLNVPCDKSGQLSFFNKDDEKIFEYQPKNDDFIIMPDYMRHNPQKSLAEEYRISINLEITVE